MHARTSRCLRNDRRGGLAGLPATGGCGSSTGLSLEDGLLGLRPTARRFVAPIVKPVWRRVWVRVENRVAVAEARVAPVEPRV